MAWCWTIHGGLPLPILEQSVSMTICQIKPNDVEARLQQMTDSGWQAISEISLNG